MTIARSLEIIETGFVIIITQVSASHYGYFELVNARLSSEEFEKSLT